jgi:hypothetical protein
MQSRCGGATPVGDRQDDGAAPAQIDVTWITMRIDVMVCGSVSMDLLHRYTSVIRNDGVSRRL